MKITNAYIEKWIRDYMSIPENNTMKEFEGPAFDLPLVGFSSATDELYPFYKRHIDPDFYRLPQEWLQCAFGKEYDAENVSVISWVLPQTKENRDKSRMQDDCPPMEWQMVRVHGEECNRNLAKALAEHLTALGYDAVAPMCSDQFSGGDMTFLPNLE